MEGFSLCRLLLAGTRECRNMVLGGQVEEPWHLEVGEAFGGAQQLRPFLQEASSVPAMSLGQ